MKDFPRYTSIKLTNKKIHIFDCAEGKILCSVGRRYQECGVLNINKTKYCGKEMLERHQAFAKRREEKNLKSHKFVCKSCSKKMAELVKSGECFVVSSCVNTEEVASAIPAEILRTAISYKQYKFLTTLLKERALYDTISDKHLKILDEDELKILSGVRIDDWLNSLNKQQASELIDKLICLPKERFFSRGRD